MKQNMKRLPFFKCQFFKLTDYSKLYQKVKINSQQIMPPRLKQIILTFAFIVILIHTVSSWGIVDFEYTEYTQALAQNSHQYGDFEFRPVQITQYDLQFPHGSNLVDLLNEPVAQKQDQAQSSDIDSYLNEMKSMFLKLLTLTQKLSNSEDKILHFETLINQTMPVPPSQAKIIELSSHQQKLSNLTDRINSLDQWLRNNLTQIDKNHSNYDSGEAKRIELDFKIDWLKEKISYLTNFQQRTRLALQRSGPQINYETFFVDLQKQFNNEQDLISQIDLIIQKKDKLTHLKKEKVNLESSISALELYIKDIQECNSQKENIRNEFKNHQKINQLIHQLKELKKNQEPNIYCEGVVKKLTQKIKTMVRYYAIVASCASDLEPKRNDLKKQNSRLDEINRNIAKLQSLDNLEDFEKVFTAQKNVIESMYSKMKDWKIKQFTHNPQSIAQIRRSAQEKLATLTKQRAEHKEIMDGQPAQQRKVISNNIVDMIKEIRQLKYEYGVRYEKYDSLANAIWSETYRFESQVNLKNNLLRMYRDERIAYENMYAEMIDLRARIYESLK